ncbi:MAG: hypothetical protein NW203_03685 [Hyphomonadaceae bacterium]|nr:hypothetical protein [Hyphomonadaceae bacterium]
MTLRAGAWSTMTDAEKLAVLRDAKDRVEIDQGRRPGSWFTLTFADCMRNVATEAPDASLLQASLACGAQ